MELTEIWKEAVKKTRILRRRSARLETFDRTYVPYILASEHPDSPYKTQVRKGRVDLTKPKLYLPNHNPQFEGFDFDQMEPNENSIMTMMYVRGIRLPSLKYENVQSCDTKPIPVGETLGQLSKELAMKEDVVTGLIETPDHLWMFSLIFYVTLLISNHIPRDLKLLMQEEIEPDD